MSTVREKDLELWEWARAKAERERTTISGVLMNALERYRDDSESREE
jgi:hypothetical protein